MNTQPPILGLLFVPGRFIIATDICRTRKTFIQGEDSSSRSIASSVALRAKTGSAFPGKLIKLRP